uniref:Uncharacterized protein n=1 Tax=Aureoumbra lagunensis TaxID=44058 RepID=A0A7S3NDP4_9STRA
MVGLVIFCCFLLIFFLIRRLGGATAIILVFGSLAAGAGIGGGGLFVPTYWLCLGVGPKAAVPLSGATILGAAFGNFLTLGWSHHPKAKRPVIDYEVATFTQPGELLGVVFGVLLNIILPRIAIIIMLALILSYNSRRTIRKGFRARAKETAARLENTNMFHDTAQGTEIKEEQNDQIVNNTNRHTVIAVSTTDKLDDEDDDIIASYQEKNHNNDKLAQDDLENCQTSEKQLAAVLAMDAVQFPFWAYALLFPMTAYLFVYRRLSRTVFKPCARWDLSERNGDPHGWAGGVYWLWYFTPVPVFATFMLICALILKRRTRKRLECPNYRFLETDLIWTNDFLRKFPLVALTAGVFAGLLGIGGGMIQGPIFLEVGMEPKCATSATAFSILWTASSSTILWYTSGNLNWQLMLWVASFGFISGQIGQHGVDHIIKKTGRPSYIIFLLGGIIAAACICMVLSGAVTIAIDATKGNPLFFLNLREFKCGVSST